MRKFKDYNKKELFDKIEKISIQQFGKQIVTKYDNRIISVADVSNRYEIFDIKKYLKDKIREIEKNFTITKYKFILERGRQYIQLISDKVEINKIEFYKSFYILNSSDKSRRLNFHIGLYNTSKDFNIIRNTGLSKKHYKGITEATEVVSRKVNDETFNEQIEAIKSIVGHKISFSKLREVILGDKEEISNQNHHKFDIIKNVIRWSSYREKLTDEQKRMLVTPSPILDIEKSNDFYLDAFFVFQEYLKIFQKEDSQIIKNETERIMKITQWSIRNNVLDELGI